MNAVALLISPFGEASAKVALDWWTARVPRRDRGESSPFGLSMLLRRTASVGLHPFTSLGRLISGCRRQAFACPSQGAPKGTINQLQLALSFLNRSRCIVLRVVTLLNRSPVRRYSLTSLLIQRRGKRTEFQKIHVSRNQHAIHHRCPQLSTTSGPGQANNSERPHLRFGLDSSQPAWRLRHMNPWLHTRGQVHPASQSMHGLKMPLQ